MGPILICGGGAIGSWLAGRLAAAGKEVHLLSRKTRTEAFRTHGLILETLSAADPQGAGGTERFGTDQVHFLDAAAKAPHDPDLLIMATRAYQTAAAAGSLFDAGIHPGHVLTLQNGLGNAEVLAERFGMERVLAGTTSHGVTWVDPSTVRHAGFGDTYVGPWVPAAEAIAKRTVLLLGSAGIPAWPVGDPRRALWLKVAVNAAINPPTALHEVPNGALLDGGPLEADLKAAAREVALVATEEGTPIDPDEAAAAALKVAKRTAENRSSMLQARLAGRPLEIEAITGEVVRRAVAHGLGVPVNMRHLEALRALPPAR